jgi:hypothetical protein
VGRSDGGPEPGIILDGKLVTTDSLISTWASRSSSSIPITTTGRPDGVRFATDPSGNPISPNHPWNKYNTSAADREKNFKEKYSWSTAPRWDRQVVENGTYGRMWTNRARPKDSVETPSWKRPATDCGWSCLVTSYPRTELFWKVTAHAQRPRTQSWTRLRHGVHCRDRYE